MNLIIAPDDVLLQTTLYYRQFASFYQNIVAEFCPDAPPMNILRCPNEREYIQQALNRLEHAQYKETLLREIRHLFSSYHTRYRMSLMPGAVEGCSLLQQSDVDSAIVLCAGQESVIAPSIDFHGVENVMYVEYVPAITPETFAPLMSRYNYTLDDTMFIGSSPARELNAALAAGLNVSRVYMSNYILYDEALFSDVPTFQNFYDLAQAIHRI